jgi:hypothetical protein
MSELDRYLKDPSKKLIRTASGKFQFVDVAPKAAARPAMKSAPKTATANAVPGTKQVRPRIGGGSIATPKTKYEKDYDKAVESLPPGRKKVYDAAKAAREAPPPFKLKPSRVSMRRTGK